MTLNWNIRNPLSEIIDAACECGDDLTPRLVDLASNLSGSGALCITYQTPNVAHSSTDTLFSIHHPLGGQFRISIPGYFGRES